MTHFDLTPRSPVERWNHLQEQLRKARLCWPAMADIYEAADVREQAAADYSQHVVAAITELDALDIQGALYDVPELLDLTYGRA
ncbi:MULTISPECIES: hypothetical protein [Roseobacteraceae]|uniref:hypothetical protein n=1 Tax=Roseobacteraceae TaxID=2854170 RepID=UPI002B2686C2|nr:MULTISPECIES: hypothetical protein [Roseobacteraceae]